MSTTSKCLRFTIYYKFNNYPTQSERDQKSGEFEFVKNYVLKCKMSVLVPAPNHHGLSGLSTPLWDPPQRSGSPAVEYTLFCGTGSESVCWCCLWGSDRPSLWSLQQTFCEGSWYVEPLVLGDAWQIFWLTNFPCRPL